MNEVALAHLASLPIGALIVAFIFSINLQGPRCVEPWWRGTIRRFLKIVGLLAYAIAIVQLLSFGAEARGTARTLASGAALAMIAGMLAFMLRPHRAPAAAADDDATDDATEGASEDAAAAARGAKSRPVRRGGGPRP